MERNKLEAEKARAETLMQYAAMLDRAKAVPAHGCTINPPSDDCSRGDGTTARRAAKRVREHATEPVLRPTVDFTARASKQLRIDENKEPLGHNSLSESAGDTEELSDFEQTRANNIERNKVGGHERGGKRVLGSGNGPGVHSVGVVDGSGGRT